MGSRVFSHQWRDKKPFTRRVRWLCQGWDRATEEHWTRDKDIRLEFEDELGVAHRFYGNRKEDAQRDYDAFKQGLTNTTILREAR